MKLMNLKQKRQKVNQHDVLNETIDHCVQKKSKQRVFSTQVMIQIVEGLDFSF